MNACAVSVQLNNWLDDEARAEAREEAIEALRPTHQARLLCDPEWIEEAVHNYVAAMFLPAGRDTLLALSTGDDATVRDAIKVIRAQLLERAWADSLEPATEEVDNADDGYDPDGLTWGDE
jgi:hypothetical protein